MKEKNYFRISLAILVILSLAGIIIWLISNFYSVPNWPVLAAALIALLVGITALFKDIIYHFTCGPRIDIDFRLSKSAEIYDGKNDLSYNLAIKNKGLISAKRIRVKIRERDKEKERDYVSWLNLIRPLSDVWVHHSDGRIEKIKSEGEIYMDSLASNEEDYFSFGIHDKNNNNFILKTNTKIGLNNQTITIENKTKRFYSLEIVADNMPPHRYGLQITNDNELEKKVDIALITRFKNSKQTEYDQGGGIKLSFLGAVIIALISAFATAWFITNFQREYDKELFDENTKKVYQIVNAEIFDHLLKVNEYIRAKNQIVSDAYLVDFLEDTRFNIDPLANILSDNFQYLSQSDLYHLVIIRDKLASINDKNDILAKKLQTPRISNKPDCQFIYFLPEEKKQIHRALNDDFNRLIFSIKNLSFFAGNPFEDLSEYFDLTETQVQVFHFEYNPDYDKVYVNCE